MALSEREMLTMLGGGASIDTVCQAAGISREDLSDWWQREVSERVPKTTGRVAAAVGGTVEIARDRWGIPHVLASSDDDLFFGFGFAMGQDRLWQLDYLRRKATGRLAEVLGPEALEQDLTVRTVGINRIAARELELLPDETRRLLDAFCRGVNAAMDACSERMPIEFDLLDYRPEPWRPIDSVAILAEFRWYLTGRFPVIVIPELARRTLDDASLYAAFLAGEEDDESIVPHGSYPAATKGEEPVGQTVGDPTEGIGSNNWVVAGGKSTTGAPLLASDPHIAFGSISCWYEVHLCGGSFNTVGMAYAGVPAIVFGRNPKVAWGITNNICSQRDLYQEKTDPDHPGCFLYDGRWEPVKQIAEQIELKGSEPVRKTIRFSRNGPIVDEILPKPARDSGPVSLRWLGATICDELTCMLAMDRAESCDALRAAVKSWRVPTWSLIFADAGGHIGYQCVGRIPIRNNWTRGYRPGWDPAHSWQGLVPFEGMPALADPPRGWIGTANNRTAPEDFPYPLSGTWSSGYRARRIREMLEGQERFSREDFARMHVDVLSRRAVAAVPKLLEVLGTLEDEMSRQAIDHLQQWDCRMEPDRVGATIFETFFHRWCAAVAAERFSSDVTELAAGAIGGLALNLLPADEAGWFTRSDRLVRIREVFLANLSELSKRLGPDMDRWQWGRLHTLTLRHPLSARGELAALLDRGNEPVGGNGVTVCNTMYNPDFSVATGANYRLISDLSESPAGMWAVDAAGQSGHPGSSHYCDQLREWVAGRYHFLSLDREEAAATAMAQLVLQPRRMEEA